MANFIIQKEEEDDEVAFKVNTNGIIDTKELKQMYDQNYIRGDRANSNWANETYINDLNRTQSHTNNITDEVVNNVIREIQQYSLDKEEVLQHKGLLSLDQQIVKIKQLE